MIIDKVRIKIAGISFAGLLFAAFLLLPHESTTARTNDISAGPPAPCFQKATYDRPNGSPRLLAQLDSGKDGRHDGRRMQQEMRKHRRAQEDRRRHLEQFRMLKLLELLDLNEDQELKFITDFRRVRKQQEKLNIEKADILERLGTGLQQETIGDNQILELIDGIVRIENKKTQLVRAFLSESKKYLTVQQMGKMVLFHERFEYEMLDQVRSFRERNRPALEDPNSAEG